MKSHEETPPPSPSTHISFPHGLGDCSQFAHALVLWKRRGFDVRVNVGQDKAPIFRAAGVNLSGDYVRHHPYVHPAPCLLGAADDWTGNKCGYNLTCDPLPKIGEPEELWSELLGVELSLAGQVSSEERDVVDAFVDSLPSPLIVLHTRGNNNQGAKNFTPELESETYAALLRDTDATILLLDYDNRCAKQKDFRIRHLVDDFRKLSLPALWYLYERSALVVGIDSGPLHFARFSSVPSLGVWFGNHPSAFALPDTDAVHLVDRRHGDRNELRREAFQLIDVDVITADAIARIASEILDGCRGVE